MKPLTVIHVVLILILSAVFFSYSLTGTNPASADSKTGNYVKVRQEGSYLSLFFNPVSGKKSSPLVLGLSTIESPSYEITPLLIEKIIPVTSQNLDELFKKYASFYNVNENLLKKIASCESGFNPQAKNLDYAGLFQFSASTWIVTRQAMGLDTDDNKRNDAEEAIKTAAWKIANGGVSSWPICSR